MTARFKFFWFWGLVALAFVSSCAKTEHNKYVYSEMPEVIQKGNLLFNNYCAACHNFKTSGIGPSLAGVTADVSPEWLKSFIQNPTKMIEANDERAAELYQRYKQYMPAFGMLEGDDLDAVMAYMHTRKANKKSIVRTEWGKPIDNPIAEKIPASDITLILKEYAQLPFTAEAGQRARVNKVAPAGDGSKRLFAHDLRGKMYELIEGKAQLFLDLAGSMPHFIEVPGHGTGLGSFAFHPEYQENGLFYTTHTEPKGTKPADFAYADTIPVKLQWILTEWTQNDPDVASFEGAHRELMRIDMTSHIHGVQEISFNPLAKKGQEDYGLLYIGVGDGGSVGQRRAFLVEDNTMVYGSILRIDPRGNNSKNGKYGVPASNPFAEDGDEATVEEVFAYGFRNPHRFTWDPNNGNMLATCIGQHYIEELNLIEKGANYGWPEREGTFRSDKESDLSKVYPLPDDDVEFDYAYPVVQFDHDEALAICGGYVYTGKSVPGLHGKYLFGGVVTGRVFMVDSKSLIQGQQAPIQEIKLQMEDGKPVSWSELSENNITGHSRIDFRMGIDAEGELYMSTKANGKIFKVVSEVKNIAGL